MSKRRCATQAELDAAAAAGAYPVLTGDGEFTVPTECAEIAVEDSSQPRIVTWDSSQPRIVTRDSSQLQIRADHALTVTAHGQQAVVTHNKHVTVDGDGIDLLVDEPTAPHAWCEHYGVDVASDGTVVLFKRVNDTFRSEYNGGLLYAPGETVTAADWNDQPACGGGLHLSPHPSLTSRYSQAERLVAVRVVAADVVPIPSWDADAPDKCKVRSCVVLYECDEDGEPLLAPVEAAS